MLQVTDLTKIYNRLVANDHLNFTVNPGEIAVLLGPNGAGKIHGDQMHRGPFAFPGKYHDLRPSKQERGGQKGVRLYPGDAGAV